MKPVFLKKTIFYYPMPYVAVTRAMLREESLFVAPAYFWVSPEDLYGMYCGKTSLGTVYSPTAQTQDF